MTEMTSVGMDMNSVVICLCVTNPGETNSLIDLYRKEVGYNDCVCHNAS